MRVLRTVILREIREWVRRRSFWISTLLAPVLMLGMSLLPMLMTELGGNKEVTLVALDRTQTGIAQKVIQEIPKESAAHLKMSTPSATLKTLKVKVLEKELDGVFVLDPSKTKGGPPVAHLYGRNTGRFEITRTLQRALRNAWLNRAFQEAGADSSLLDLVNTSVHVEDIKITAKGEKKGGFLQAYFSALIMSVLLMMLLLGWGVALMRGVMEERRNKIGETLFTVMAPEPMMLGKIMGIGSVGLLQFFIWGLLGLIVALINPVGIWEMIQKSGSAPSLTVLCSVLIFFILGFFFFASLYAIIGSWASDDHEAQQWMMPINFSLVAPMMVLPLLIRMPEGPVAVFLTFFPFTTPLVTVLRLAVGAIPVWQVFLAVAEMVVAIAIMGWIAGKLYRIGMLMTGQKLSLPSLIKALKQKS